MRYRAKLVCLRTNCKLQVYAVLAKEGVAVPMSDLFGVAGTELLESCHLATAYRTRVESLRALIEVFDRQITMLEADVRHELRGQVGYEAAQKIPGVGPLFASVFVAEIGDVTRFRSPAHLASCPPEARFGPGDSYLCPISPNEKDVSLLQPTEPRPFAQHALSRGRCVKASFRRPRRP